MFDNIFNLAPGVNLKMTEEREIYEKITFSGVTKEDRVIFENRELKIILINIFNPILKIEKCVWLNEF